MHSDFTNISVLRQPFPPLPGKNIDMLDTVYIGFIENDGENWAIGIETEIRTWSLE